MPARRIAAVVLPELACELARRSIPSPGPKRAGPLAVIVGSALRPSSEANATLDAISEEARRYGVRPGQTVVEASALITGLTIRRVDWREIEAALGAVAEVSMGFGITAAIRLDVPPKERLPFASAPEDTVWVDVTGAAHLLGGEETLAALLAQRVAELGHRVRVAIAEGPRLAQALARFGNAAEQVIPLGEAASALAPLPVRALPLAPEVVAFLVRLGVLTVSDLVRLPRAALSSRLGARAAQAMDLAQGRDDVPLVAYEPARELEESTTFEEPVESSEALLFVLRGMASRVGARLAARGEATTRIVATIPLDRSIALLRMAEAQSPVATAFDRLTLSVDLPAPLADPSDLMRALKAKLERTELFAPAVGLTLAASHIVRAPRVQLDLSRKKSASPDALPALLAELGAEIGVERVGILEVVDAHRPEARTRLRVTDVLDRRKNGKTASLDKSSGGEWSPTSAGALAVPTRLLPEPVPLGRAIRGGVVALGKQIYTVENVHFTLRLDGVEWWTPHPIARDYARAWLSSGAGGGEAFIYIDRTVNQGFLAGWFE